jgi:hypothetical protein
MLGFRFTRGGGDYCDAVYDLPNGGIDPRRAIEFHHEQLFQVTGASFMFAIGLALLAYIFLRAHKKQTKLNIWAVIAVLTMMFGYVVVILSSGSSGQNC